MLLSSSPYGSKWGHSPCADVSSCTRWVKLTPRCRRFILSKMKFNLCYSYSLQKRLHGLHEKKSKAGQRWTLKIVKPLELLVSQLTHLADMGVLSMEELLLVLSLLPLAIGVDAFLGVEEPKPTGVCRREESLPPPDLMLEDLKDGRVMFKLQ